MVNTSVQEGEAPKQHTQHGGEGRAPHRAEAFVAMKSSEERCQAVTTHHAKHDNRAVASTTRYPEGGTSRALSGPECTRGQTEGAGRAGGKKQGESKPSRPNPEQQTQSRTEQPRENNSKTTTASRTHDTKNKTQTKREKTRATKGKPKQAEASTPYFAVPNVLPKETNQEGAHKRTRGRTVGCQETRRKTKPVENELKSTSAPAQSADRHTSTKAVRIKIWEDRNRCKNVPVQAAGMHVGNRAVQRGSRP